MAEPEEDLNVDPRLKRQRERWLRNKRDERRRLREKRQTDGAIQVKSAQVDPEFLQTVWAERDRRLRNFPWRMPDLPDRKFFRNSSNFASQALVCDVWAAEVIMAAENTAATLTAGKIATFLIKEGRKHDVKATSLRTKVWRALSVVRFLETAPIWNRPGMYWPQFPESVHEHGSGVMQHVDQVMAYLELLHSPRITKDGRPIAPKDRSSEADGNG